jgi:hypothetical protein
LLQIAYKNWIKKMFDAVSTLAICFNTADLLLFTGTVCFGHFDVTFDNIPFTLYSLNVRTGHCGHVALHDLKVNYRLDLSVRMLGQSHPLLPLLSLVAQEYTSALGMALVLQTKF